MSTPTLIVIGGPTASGKTAAAVAIAKHLGTEVISSDSRQFYADMLIGTARPTEQELQGVPHHFLGHLGIEDTWSAGAFGRAAEPVLQEILAKYGTAVLVGGSGLYIDALLKGLDPLPLGDIRFRERAEERLKREGLEVLVAELKERDPATWERIDRQNPHRVLRALEVCVLTGKPYSEQRSIPKDRSDLRIVRIAMDLPRKDLYQRIDERVDAMMEAGLEAEVRGLLPYRECNSLRTVGYRELFMHFDGELTLEQSVELIKQRTRNYAKRQVTWLRRETEWTMRDPFDHSGLVEHVLSVLA